MQYFPTDINPTEENRKIIQNIAYIELGFNNLSKDHKDKLLQFYSANKNNLFYYITKNKYTYTIYDAFGYINEPDFIIVNDEKNEVSNLYVNDTIKFIGWDREIVFTDSNTINPPFTLFVEQLFSSGNVNYLTISNSDIKIKINQEDERFLAISVETSSFKETKRIHLKKTILKVANTKIEEILYALCITNDVIFFAHNGNCSKIKINSKANLNNLDVYSNINILNFLLINKITDEEFLGKFLYPIGYTVPFVLDELNNVIYLLGYNKMYIYGRIRYIAHFAKDVVVFSSGEDNFLLKMYLKEFEKHITTKDSKFDKYTYNDLWG